MQVNNFISTGSRKKNQQKDQANKNEDRTPTGLSMYTEPPTQEITLTLFENLGMARLKILKALDNAKATNASWPDKYFDILAEKGAELDRANDDHMSHFILRLVYCRSEELRRW